MSVGQMLFSIIKSIKQYLQLDFWLWKFFRITFISLSHNLKCFAFNRTKKGDSEPVNIDRLLPLLEVLQGRKTIKDIDSLVPALFALLARLDIYKNDLP